MSASWLSVSTYVKSITSSLHQYLMMRQTKSDNESQENILMIRRRINVRRDNKRNVILTLAMMATMGNIGNIGNNEAITVNIIIIAS